MAQTSTKFIKRNRPPRVHIEYEVQTYGASEKVSLPFVMGVLSDLSGKSEKEKKEMPDRDFSDVSMDNFGEFQKSIAPARYEVLTVGCVADGKNGICMRGFDGLLDIEGIKV